MVRVTCFISSLWDIDSGLSKPVKATNIHLHPSQIADVVSSSQKNIRTHLPGIQRSMQLYLANRDTEFILFKPIRANVLSTFSKVQNIVTENYNEDDRIIIACPSQEEVSALLSSLFKS